jgi:hypothetical protein
MSQFNRVGALGVGDQATGDQTPQMPRKVSAVHVIYLAVWMVADRDPVPRLDAGKLAWTTKKHESACWGHSCTRDESTHQDNESFKSFISSRRADAAARGEPARRQRLREKR